MGVEWKELLSDRYLIGSNSQIKSVYYNRILKGCVNLHGYRFFYLKKGKGSINIYLHREIAKHFIPNPEKHKNVIHSDCNLLNNAISNLEWADYARAYKHRISCGSYSLRGIKGSILALGEAETVDIFTSKKTRKELSEIYSVCLSTINNIKNRKRGQKFTRNISA